VKSADFDNFVSGAESRPACAVLLSLQIRIIILAIAAFSFLFTASAQSPPSVSDMLAQSSSLGPGWDRKIYLLFDSVAVPSEIVQTIKAPPESALNDWRRGVQDPNGRISGWVLAHYNLISSANSPKYEVHLERYRSHDALLADFEKLLESAVAQPGSMPLTHIGDADALVASPQGTGAKVWFRRGNYRVWISQIGAPNSQQLAPSLQLLAQAIDQRIASVNLHLRAVVEGADLMKKALDETVKSPNSSATMPQYVVKVGGAFIPISKTSSSNSVSFAFDHWSKQGSDAESLAVFRLTNSGPGSILLWNVRVQNSTTDVAITPSGWEAVQDDYPSATTAVCEPRSSIEFWVSKPIMIPWRVCVIFSRELSESDRPKDSQRAWGGNFEAIGRPVD